MRLIKAVYDKDKIEQAIEYGVQSLHRDIDIIKEEFKEYDREDIIPSFNSLIVTLIKNRQWQLAKDNVSKLIDEINHDILTGYIKDIDRILDRLITLEFILEHPWAAELEDDIY